MKFVYTSVVEMLDIRQYRKDYFQSCDNVRKNEQSLHGKDGK